MNPYNAKTSGSILLNKMEFYAFHGVSPEEQKIGRTFYVDVSIDYDFEEAAIEGDLEKTVDYARVYSLVAAEMKVTERLMETLSRRIAWKIKGDYPKATKLTVSIAKSAPIVGGKIDSTDVQYTIH